MAEKCLTAGEMTANVLSQMGTIAIPDSDVKLDCEDGSISFRTQSAARDIDIRAEAETMPKNTTFHVFVAGKVFKKAVKGISDVNVEQKGFQLFLKQSDDERVITEVAPEESFLPFSLDDEPVVDPIPLDLNVIATALEYTKADVTTLRFTPKQLRIQAVELFAYSFTGRVDTGVKGITFNVSTKSIAHFKALTDASVSLRKNGGGGTLLVIDGSLGDENASVKVTGTLAERIDSEMEEPIDEGDSK